MRFLFVLCSAVLLAACASAPPAPPAASSALFEFVGRLSVRQGEASHHVGVRWRREAERDEILLSGPLGQGIAELSRDAAGARMLTAERQSYSAPDWEGLAERVLGARLPLSDLPQWLTAPYATNGPAPTFHAEGWKIDVLEVAAGRPALLELRRDDIEVRLKIDEWLQ